jgi:hypothetical protein
MNGRRNGFAERRTLLATTLGRMARQMWPHCRPGVRKTNERNDMPRDHGSDWLRRGISDFAMALVLFWATVFLVHGDHNRAHAVAAPRIGKETIRSAADPGPVGWQGATATPVLAPSPGVDKGQRQGLFLLSVAFAAITALNLGFLRHLRRVYASPRRSVWRRGRQRMGG